MRIVAGERLGHGRPREARGDQGEDRPAGTIPVPEVRWIQGARPRPVSTHATKRKHTNKILPSPRPPHSFPRFKKHRKLYGKARLDISGSGYICASMFQHARLFLLATFGPPSDEYERTPQLARRRDAVRACYSVHCNRACTQTA